MEIEILATREKEPDFVSRKIMKFMKTDYSHVLIRAYFEGKPYIFHATGRGVHILEGAEYSDYLSNHEIAVSISVPIPANEKEFWCYCNGAKGLEYSQSALAMIGLGLGKYFKQNDKTWCSALIWDTLKFFRSDIDLGMRGECQPVNLIEKLTATLVNKQ